MFNLYSKYSRNLREVQYLGLQREVRILSRYEMQLAKLFMINCNYLQNIKYYIKENSHICLNRCMYYDAFDI